VGVDQVGVDQWVQTGGCRQVGVGRWVQTRWV